jgi:hypothetical protein
MELHVFLVEGDEVNLTLWPFYSRRNSPWYPLDRRLDGAQNRLGSGREEKNSCPCRHLANQLHWTVPVKRRKANAPLNCLLRETTCCACSLLTVLTHNVKQETLRVETVSILIWNYLIFEKNSRRNASYGLSTLEAYYIFRLFYNINHMIPWKHENRRMFDWLKVIVFFKYISNI